LAAWRSGAKKTEAKDNAPFEAPLEARGKQGKEAQSAQRYPTPPAFCKKRLQVVENKQGEREKESKERPRGGKLLSGRNLRQEHRNSAGERAVAAKTHWVAEERRDETGTLSA
jgi:hypothetical protein